MARIGHSSAAAALRYQHVIDGQDAEIVSYLERFGDDANVPVRAPGNATVTDSGGHAVGTPTNSEPTPDQAKRSDPEIRGGGDGTRTHDFLLAKQVL